MSFDLDELIAEARAAVENAEPRMVPATLAGRQIGVRFIPMSGADWRHLVQQHPPRGEDRRDGNLGYNFDAVVAAYPEVAIIKGDDIDDLIRVDAEGKRYSKWPEVWAVLSSSSRKDIEMSIWHVHEVEPEQLVVEAGKA